MNEIIKICLIYIIGGVTFIPCMLVFVYYISSEPSSIPITKEETKPVLNQQGKKGWIKLSKQYKRRDSTVMAGIRRQKEHVFAELKGGALFIYQDGQQEDCLLILPIHNYNVSIFSPKEQPCLDNEIFGKLTAIKLTPTAETEEEVLLEQGPKYHLTSMDALFISCVRPVDKEDWYFGLLAATQMMTTAHVEMVDNTHFDPYAMETLITTMQQDAAYREVQWLNAIVGRLFLSLYKTQEIKAYFQAKITKKTQKIQLPSYLGEILIESVDIGHAIPYITQPKLLSLTPEGDLVVEANVAYAGGLRVVIRTDFSWMYSSLMKPIRIPLVLSVTLKQLSGKIILKIKPPPTNRYWIGFEALPVMDWEITPVVSDKQIRLSMVTNAIQSKIREFMVDNIVLPNMEDIAFCPSEGLGGIFGERIPKPSTPPPSPPATKPGVPLDMLGNMYKKVVPPTSMQRAVRLHSI